MDIKLFICVWGVGYIGCHKRAKIEINFISFFTDESGFDEKDIQDIQDLDVGQCHKLYASGNLSVTRIR